MLIPFIAVVLCLQPEPPAAGPAPQAQPEAKAPATAQSQPIEPKWVWKLNDAHRYRVERDDDFGKEIITYKLVVRAYGKRPEFHEKLGLPDVNYAEVVVTIESVYHKDPNAAKPDCDTEHPGEIQSSVTGKLYAALPGRKGGFVTDDTGRVFGAKSVFPQEIANAETGDPGSFIEEAALGSTFALHGLMARMAEITSTLAPALTARNEVMLEPMLQEVSGIFVASKDIARIMKREDDVENSPIRIIASGELKILDDAKRVPPATLKESSFDRMVVFSPLGFVQSSTGKVRWIFDGEQQQTLEFKVECLPKPPPEPPYVPKSERKTDGTP